MQADSFQRTGSIAGGSRALRTAGVDKDDRGSQRLGSHGDISAMMRSLFIQLDLV